MKMTPARIARYYYLRFKRLKGDPRAIARGVALGVFIGITPTIPFHTIALLITIPLLRANVVATFLSSMCCCNPLTYFAQYYFSWRIGTWLTPYDLTWERIKAVMDIVFSGAGAGVVLPALSQVGAEVAVVLVVGGCVLGAPFSLLAYFMSLRFFTRLREQKKKAGRRGRESWTAEGGSR